MARSDTGVEAPGATPVVAVVRALAREIVDDPTRRLTLADLARRAGYSPAYLQRKFAAIIGSSPKAFQTAARMRLLRQGLRSAGTVAAAIAGAGFGSGSRVYERADAELGMTPGAYRRGGAGLTIGYASGQTPLGRIMIGATERGICYLGLGSADSALLEELRREFPAAELVPMPVSYRREFASWMKALRAYLGGRAALPDSLPVDLQGTAFQLLVWRYLRSIPHGEAQSYSRVAAGIGRPRAARAVARACATNRVALLVPCHRVVRGSGDIAGYRWGTRRKRALLAAERTARAGRPG